MKTPAVSNNFSPTKPAKPYYLTREKTPEELIKINREKKHAKILIGTCVTSGLFGTVLYFLIKRAKSL